jgi:hypothetical protein
LINDQKSKKWNLPRVNFNILCRAYLATQATIGDWKFYPKTILPWILPAMLLLLCSTFVPIGWKMDMEWSNELEIKNQMD